MRFLLVIIFIFGALAGVAQDSAATVEVDTTYSNLDEDDSEGDLNEERAFANDSSAVLKRSFNQTTLSELKQNEDFNYRQPPTVVESLWDRFLNWLGEIFGWLFRGATGTNWGRVLLYTLGLVVLIAIVMMLLKVDALRVFKSETDKGSLNYDAFTENIHEMDFDTLIRQALDKKEYRLGVRLTFLYALKILADKQHLDWKPGKTNHDYLAELKEGELKTGFNELSFYFDYTWYGDFNVNENLFQRVRSIFDNWRAKVK